MNERNELIAIICDEEKAAVTNAIERRIAAIKDRPDGPFRARMAAAAHLSAASEFLRLLEGDEAAARQLRRIADAIEAQSASRH